MRLLRTDGSRGDYPTFEFDEFYGEYVPPYAILSHTWEEEEVTLAEILNGTGRTKKGFVKIRFVAGQAQHDGYQYVWVDTCCIDKTSSAELSEAINSMYNWYKCAARCYAYLVDVPAGVDMTAERSAFTQSRWFTRGFCLQELLAPKDCLFYANSWVLIGSKHDLKKQISRITRIDPAILTGERSLDTVNIAQKMAWAATRKTTRPEDIAYCLMGLFSVNMPMLYGEGSRAFQRLQEEIIKHSNDHSIFVWTNPRLKDGEMHGLLADSPMDFINSGNIIQYPIIEDQALFNMTNRGLHINLRLTKCEDKTYAAVLNCPIPHARNYGEFAAIYIRRIQPGIEQYARVKCSRLGTGRQGGHERAIFVQQKIIDTRYDVVYPTHAFQLHKMKADLEDYELRDWRQALTSAWMVPQVRSDWVPASIPTTFKIQKEAGHLSAALHFVRRSDEQGFWLLMGSTTWSEIGFSIIDCATVRSNSIHNLRPHFRPQPSGEVMLFEDHRVCVDTVTRIRADIKFYMLDICIERNPDHKPSNTMVESSNGLHKQKTLPKQGKGSRWRIKTPWQTKSV